MENGIILLKDSMCKIAFGGGCHWCTEAVFQSLKGVEKVEQGFVASTGMDASFSEAVIVHFNENVIQLRTLIEIHLHTHRSTSAHSMRTKYRSAVYWFHIAQKEEAVLLLNEMSAYFSKQLITKVYAFKAFKPSRASITNYYYKNPEKPFCKTFINPKLSVLLKQFAVHVNTEKLKPFPPLDVRS
jgi:peptide-methionine (S)-S-oxide reductase